MEREDILFKIYGKFYPKGTILFKEDDPGEELFIIQSGAVRVTHREGGREVASTKGPGEFLGEDTLLERAPRKEMAEVLEDSRLLVLDSRTVEGFVRNGPELAFSLVKKLTGRLTEVLGELNQWNRRFNLSKLEPFLRQPPSGEGWTLERLSEQSGVEEGDVLEALEGPYQSGAIIREQNTYRVADFARLEILSKKIAAGAPSGNRRPGDRL